MDPKAQNSSCVASLASSTLHSSPLTKHTKNIQKHWEKKKLTPTHHILSMFFLTFLSRATAAQHAIFTLVSHPPTLVVVHVATGRQWCRVRRSPGPRAAWAPRTAACWAARPRRRSSRRLARARAGADTGEGGVEHSFGERNPGHRAL